MAEQEIKGSLNYAAKALEFENNNAAINQYENQTTVLRIDIPEELNEWDITVEFISYGESGFGDMKFLTKTLPVINGSVECVLEGAVLSKCGEVFAALTARSGDKVWKTVFDKTKPAFSIKESIHNAIALEFKDGFVENLVKLEGDLQRMEHKTQCALDEVNAVLPKLRNDLDVVLEEVKLENNEKLTDYVDEKFQQVDETVGIAVANSNQAAQTANQMAAKLAEDAHEVVNFALNKVDTHISNANSAVNTLINNSEMDINRLLNNSESAVNTLISNSEVDINRLLNDSESGINKVINDATEDFNTLLQENSTKLSGYGASFESLLSDSKIEIEDAIFSAGERISNFISNASTANEEKLNDFEEYLTEIDNSTQTKLMQMISEKTAQIDTDLGIAIANSNKAAQTANQMADKLAEDAHEVVNLAISKVDTHINNSTQTINNLISDSSTAINNHIVSTQTEINNQINSSNSSLNQFINDTGITIDNRLNASEQTITQLFNDFKNQGADTLAGLFKDHPYMVSGYSRSVRMKIRQSNGYGKSLLNSLWTNKGNMMFIGVMADLTTNNFGLFYGSSSKYMINNITYANTDGLVHVLIKNVEGDCVVGTTTLSSTVQTVLMFEIGD